MNTGTVVKLVLAALLVIVGGLIFAAALISVGFDFSKLGNVKVETNTYTPSGKFDGIIIEGMTDDVTFKKSTDGTRIVCRESEKLKHTVSVDNKTLRVIAEDTRKWYDHITFFGSKDLGITVYLPEGEYSSLSLDITTGDVNVPDGFTFDTVKIDCTTGDVEYSADATTSLEIKTTTGDIEVSDVKTGKMSLKVTTGDIEVNDVNVDGEIKIKHTTGEAELDSITCGSLVSEGATGDIVLERVIVENLLSVKTSTGDIIFEECDAGEVYAKATTGSVSGTLLSEKVFITDTSTGNTDVPKTATGGRCEITTTTGDIRIKVK